MDGLELALKYSPHIMFDKAEPFDIKGMGYTIFTESALSESFLKIVTVDPGKVAFVVEYAVYFDYDIQHLYDLEHVWVYVDHDGRVCDVEASFHGDFLKAMIFEPPVFIGDTHFRIFCQPGKHAFLPDGALFKLIPNWVEACNVQAGADGLLVADMFSDRLSTRVELQEKIQKYIREKYSFQPTLEFEYRPLGKELFMSWEELNRLIPERIEKELALIR